MESKTERLKYFMSYYKKDELAEQLSEKYDEVNELYKKTDKQEEQIDTLNKKIGILESKLKEYEQLGSRFYELFFKKSVEDTSRGIAREEAEEAVEQDNDRAYRNSLGYDE